MKADCFPDTKMRFMVENPPFGQPWGGKDAAEGVEEAVNKEKNKTNSRWGSGYLPGTGDMQLLFIQSAVDKMDDTCGRAAIIENGSPLFTGGTSSGESQIRRWLLEKDLIEATIALPTDLFYNTGIATYIWVLSKNKSKKRWGKIQLIDASGICHSLRKSLGNKRNEITPEDRKKITELYANFEENELCQIYDNEEFMYREYAVKQPLQRSYAINDERIENLVVSGALSSVYDEAKVNELENSEEELSAKDEKTLEKLKAGKPVYDSIFETLNANKSKKKYLEPKSFTAVIEDLFPDMDKKLVGKIVDGLSMMDKDAEIQKDKKGNVLWDNDTKDTEIVKYSEKIEDYMAREVLPHIPDAEAFFEEDLGAKKPVVKTGAEIPFTRYFYKYQQPKASKKLAKEFVDLDKSVNKRIAKLFG